MIDDSTLAFPNYDGNGMYLSTGNVSQTGRIGLLFIDFVRPRRIRIEGAAELAFDHQLMSKYPGAQFLVVVHAEAIYPNCPRYIHRLDLVESSAFTPTGYGQPPVPEWKRSDWARDVLPKGDPAQESEG